MRVPTRVILLFTILCGAFIGTFAHSPAQDAKAATGSVSGRIIHEDKALPGVSVVLMSAEFGPRQRPMARATTDGDGRYRLTGVPAGHYNVMPLAPVYVVSGGSGPGLRGGKPVNVAAGENVEGIDFSLVRGGVITGRITDADGKPVVGQYMRIEAIDERGQKLPVYLYNPYGYETDDRGIYRVYGLPAGRYLVSVGESQDGGPMTGRGGGYYTRTFYPHATEEAQAKPIEVSPGSEVTDIDITLGRLSKTYSVSGRVVDADTGQPVPNVFCSYGSVTRDGRSLMNYGGGAVTSNARGEFQLEGIRPGRYAAFVTSMGQPNASYSEATPFEVIDRDLSGLEIKVRRGATVSGVVVVEGTTNRAILAKLANLSLGASTRGTAPGLNMPDSARGNIAADGSFHLTGLRPGKVMFFFASYPPPKGLSLSRVEHNGVEQREGIEVGPGEQVTGVRVVLAYGTGVIRGQVQVQNGMLTEDVRMGVMLRRAGSTTGPFAGRAEVDARGRFVIDGLSAGEYELMLQIYRPRPPVGPPPPPVRKVVNVTDGTETTVTLVLDLNAGVKQEGTP